MGNAPLEKQSGLPAGLREQQGQGLRACCPNVFSGCSRTSAKRGLFIFARNPSLRRSAPTPNLVDFDLGNRPLTLDSLNPRRLIDGFKWVR